MKKFNFAIILGALLTLTACNNFPSGSEDYSYDYGEGNSETSFLPSPNDNGHNAIMELGNRENGVSIDFELSNYIDSTLTDKLVGNISRLKSLEWATVTTTLYQGQETETSTIGGAIEYLLNFNKYYYLDTETNQFVYYGETPNPEVNFSIATIETFFTLNEYYFGALLLPGVTATYEVIAGQRCLTFVIDGDLYNDYSQGAKMVVSYNVASRLLMKMECTTVVTNDGIPSFYQQSFIVKSVKDVKNVPTLIESIS